MQSSVKLAAVIQRRRPTIVLTRGWRGCTYCCLFTLLITLLQLVNYRSGIKGQDCKQILESPIADQQPRIDHLCKSTPQTFSILQSQGTPTHTSVSYYSYLLYVAGLVGHSCTHALSHNTTGHSKLVYLLKCRCYCLLAENTCTHHRIFGLCKVVKGPWVETYCNQVIEYCNLCHSFKDALMTSHI